MAMLAGARVLGGAQARRSSMGGELAEHISVVLVGTPVSARGWRVPDVRSGYVRGVLLPGGIHRDVIRAVAWNDGLLRHYMGILRLYMGLR